MFKKIAKEILKDPGFGFAVSGILLFAQMSPVGLAATATCAVLTAGIRAVRVIDPPFMQKDNWFSKTLKDDRTPLRILGLAMVPVIGATILTSGVTVAGASTGILDFIAKGWSSVIVPVVTGAVFATADFMLAMQFSVAQQKENMPKVGDTVKEKLTAGKIIKTALTQPETYIAIGFMGIGLMAGAWSALAFPFVIAGYAGAMKNIINGDPDHKGHPKIHYAIANMCFGVVGVIQGNYLAAVANFNNGPYMAVLEASLTPGGWRQVMKDVKKSILSIFKRDDKAQADFTVPEPASSLTAQPPLQEQFRQAPQPVNILSLAKGMPNSNPYKR